MERLLVTGIDTIAGGNLALALADRCEVLGLYDRIALESPAVQSARWQPDDPATLAAHFERWQPQWLIHCGPLSAASWNAEPANVMHREAEVVAPMVVLAEQWGCPLTVIASDAVFCGPRMFHDERSPGTSNSPRAIHQRAMEGALEQTAALIVRTHTFGWSFGAETGFAESAYAALLSGRAIETDGRRYATPLLATDLAELLWRAHELRLQGLYHLAGAERTSVHRFVAELAASLGLPATAAPRDEPHADASWHDETSLNSKRARRALAASTPMLREGIDRFVAQAHGGWRSAWRPLGEMRPLHEMAA